MSVSMPQYDNRSVVIPRDLSPELALIDASLAEAARRDLDTPDTLARLAELPRSKPVDGHRPPARARARRAGRPRRLALAGAIAGAITAGAALVGPFVPTGDDESPPPTAPTEAAQPRSPASKPPAQPRSSPPAAKPAAKPPAAARPAAVARRFAWAPVAGASGYHVEIFAGPRRIFAVDTTAPQMQVPRTWRHAGQLRRLRPGEYRWFVWARVDGVRRSEAIVQAQLVVPSS